MKRRPTPAAAPATLRVEAGEPGQRLARMLCVVALACLVLAATLERFSPFPSAEPRLGTDEPFAVGPLRRTLGPRQPPSRWTRDHDLFRFHGIPGGGASVDVALSGHATAVDVIANRERIGTLAPKSTESSLELPARRGSSLDIELVTQPQPGGPPGARLDRVRVRHPRSWLPSLRTCLLLAVPGLLAAFGAARTGMKRVVAALLGLAVAALEAALLWPAGLLHSAYAVTLALVLGLGSLLAMAFARLCEGRVKGVARAAFASLLVAVLVQVAAATSPVMVVSDLLFHAHKLEQVARGDYFPTSVTQHAKPFTIPYGVSFYAVLAPFAGLGIDPPALVRAGAAAAGILASAALFLLLAPQGGAVAAAATILFQLLPANFDAFSYGNLSHVFGHSMTLLFFCWWCGRKLGAWPLGALLLAAGMLAHFASLITLLVLCGFLVALDYRRLAADRTRLAALGLGLLAACLYYSRFVPLMLAELPGLAQGSGATGQSRAFLDRVWFELQWARIRWGLPAMLLALAGWPRTLSTDLDRGLLGFWLTGGVLALAALFTPLDVRYLYALTPPLAISGARGAARLFESGKGGHLLAWAMLATQLSLALANIVDAVYFRYRP